MEGAHVVSGQPVEFRANATDVAGLLDYVTRFAPRYREIAKPTVVITGDSDEIVLEEIHSKGLARDIAGSELVWIAGLGHKPDYIVTEIAIAGIAVTLLGTVIDSSSILLIVLPLMLPIAEQFGMNLIWFGVVTVVAVEIGLLTPPFGLSAYVVKSALNDPRITLGDIFRGTGPFTLIMVGVLLLLMAFPSLSLVLLK